MQGLTTMQSPEETVWIPVTRARLASQITAADAGQWDGAYLWNKISPAERRNLAMYLRSAARKIEEKLDAESIETMRQSLRDEAMLAKRPRAKAVDMNEDNRKPVVASFADILKAMGV